MRYVPKSLWHIAFGNRTVEFDSGMKYTPSRRDLLGITLHPSCLTPRLWGHWKNFVTEPEPGCAHECRRYRFGRKKGKGWATSGECFSDASHGFGKHMADLASRAA